MESDEIKKEIETLKEKIFITEMKDFLSFDDWDFINKTKDRVKRLEAELKEIENKEEK